MRGYTRFLALLLFICAAACTIVLGMPSNAAAGRCCILHDCAPPCMGVDWTGHYVLGVCTYDPPNDCDYLGECACP